jgi:hypothetical protein
MTPKYRARKYKKLTAQITKLTQQEYCVVVRKAGSTVEGHTQCRPRRKEGKNVDRIDKIDRIDSNKKHTRFADSGNNTPELGKEQPPREEKLGTQFRPQGTPNGERR